MAHVFHVLSSQVWYQSYSNTRDEIFQFVTDLLSKTMDVNFEPGFIIKATWHKMRPHFIAEEDQVGHCPRINKQEIISVA